MLMLRGLIRASRYNNRRVLPIFSPQRNASFWSKLFGKAKATPKQPDLTTHPGMGVFQRLGLSPHVKPPIETFVQLTPAVRLSVASDYFLGRKDLGLEPNLRQAIEIWQVGLEERCAESACALALLALSNSPERSELVYEPADAIRVLESFPSHPRALFILGYHLLHGILVEKDVKKGISCLEKAHELGDGQAAIHLAEFAKSEGNEKAYLEYLELSARVDPRGKYNWAVELNKRGKHKEAFQLFLEQVDVYPAAAYNVGMGYLMGHGTDINPKLAFEFIQKAADKNFWPAKHNLANFLVEGLIVEKDIATAKILFQDIVLHAPPEYKGPAQSRLQELEDQK